MIQRVAWAMRQTTGSATRKAVLISLADHEHGATGKCCPSVDRMAEQLEMGERTVRRALEELEAAGFISRERQRRQDGSWGGYTYSFTEDDHRTNTTQPPAGAAADPPVTDDRTTGQSGRSRGTGVEPEVNLEPETALAPPANTVRWADTSRRVDRKPVNEREALLAAAIMSAWNRQAGQSLTSWDWHAKIIRRLREHPNVTPDEHERIIAANLADPWWKGPPTPSVVYGNDAQFERAMMAGSGRGAMAALDVAEQELQRIRQEEQA